jgi:hypothetical protein
MGLIKEPKNVDLSTKSEPWTEKELIDFRKIMLDIKNRNSKKVAKISKKTNSNSSPLSTKS